MHNSHPPRVYVEDERMLPRPLLRALLLLISVILCLVAIARLTDQPLVSTPPVSRVLAEAELTLVTDGVTGAVEIWQAGTLLSQLAPEEGGFIAGVQRAIHRERKKHRVPAHAPVLLQAFENGRMAIFDPSTNWRADLMGFGTDNASAFARLLAKTQEGN